VFEGAAVVLLPLISTVVEGRLLLIGFCTATLELIYDLFLS
jgi:hypothetical protein